MRNPTEITPRPVVPTFHLGGRAIQGNVASGVVYASHTIPTPHSYCWLRLAVFDRFPAVPSLCGRRIQNGERPIGRVVNERTFPSPYIQGGEEKNHLASPTPKDTESVETKTPGPPPPLPHEGEEEQKERSTGTKSLDAKRVHFQEQTNGSGERGDDEGATTATTPSSRYSPSSGVPRIATAAPPLTTPPPPPSFGAGKRVCPIITLRVELFDDESPRTCANFRRLCKGEGLSRQGLHYMYQDIRPSYKGTYFHKIIPSFCAQGGDITMRVVTKGGYNYHSSAGRGWFEDENKQRRHNEEGLLSMANNGSNSNGTQFFITTSASQEKAFNGRHVCFGRVIEGYAAFAKEVAPYGNVEGWPSRYVVVVDCGEGRDVPPLTGEEEEAAWIAASAAVSSSAASPAVAMEDEKGEKKKEEEVMDDDIAPRIRSGKWRVGRERPCLGYGIPGM